MSVRSGSGGKVDWSSDGSSYTNIPEVRKWSINPAPEIKTYASSTTGGKKKRLKGSDDYTGKIDLYIDGGNRFDAGSFNIRAGTTHYFKFYEDNSEIWLAQVFVDSVDYETDIEGGELIAATINFSREGDITYPT